MIIFKTMSKLKYILCVVLAITINSCDNTDLSSDQDKSFVKFMGSYNSDIGKDVKPFNDGYLLLATVSSVNEINTDIAIITLDKFGNSLSVDTIKHSGGNNTAGKLLMTDDGGFLLTGSYIDTTTNNEDILLVKYDAAMSQEWESLIGTEDNNEQGISVCKALTGYIVAGNTDAEDAVNGNPEGKSDILLVKVNDAGQEEWIKNHGGTGDDFTGEVMLINGGFVVVGTTESFYEPDQSAFNIILIKTNNSGNETDKMTYGGSNNDYGNSVIRCPEGYLIVGSVENISGGNSDAYVIKVDENNIHAIVWNVAFGTTLNDKAYDVIKTHTGYIVVGEKELTTGKAAYFINIDFEGTLMYENVWGGYGQAMYSIELASDGGFIMAGCSGVEENEMICLIKVNSEGEL
jgi:hypothetical protein